MAGVAVDSVEDMKVSHCTLIAVNTCTCVKADLQCLAMSSA